MAKQPRQLNLFDALVPTNPPVQLVGARVASSPPRESTPGKVNLIEMYLTDEQRANLSPEIQRKAAFALWWHERVQLPGLIADAEKAESNERNGGVAPAG